MKALILAITVLSLSAANATAWDGTDSESGESVEIEKGNLVRQGKDIEIYDSATGEYHDATVESIKDRGSTVEVEVYDSTTSTYRTLDMDRRR